MTLAIYVLIIREVITKMVAKMTDMFLYLPLLNLFICSNDVPCLQDTRKNVL